MTEGAAAVSLILTFLVVLSPYLTTSKRMHGQYFYNLNTSALVWYDNYPEASIAIQSYGPNGWPPGPRSMRPSLAKYWREHSVVQIAYRFRHGLRDMMVVSYRGYSFLKYLTPYLMVCGLVIGTRPKVFLAAVRRHAVLAVFLAFYAAVFVPAIAFYEPISGTGTARFLLAHIAPLLFALSAFLTSDAVRRQEWQVGGLPLRVQHLQLLITLTIALDIVFVARERVMTTYGGF